MLSLIEMWVLLNDWSVSGHYWDRLLIGHEISKWIVSNFSQYRLLIIPESWRCIGLDYREWCSQALSIHIHSMPIVLCFSHFNYSYHSESPVCMKMHTGLSEWRKHLEHKPRIVILLIMGSFPSTLISQHRAWQATMIKGCLGDLLGNLKLCDKFTC